MPSRKTNKTLLTEAVIPLMVAASRWLNASAERIEVQNAPPVVTPLTKGEKAAARLESWWLTHRSMNGTSRAEYEQAEFAVECLLSDDPMTDHGISSAEAMRMLDGSGVPRSVLGA